MRYVLLAASLMLVFAAPMVATAEHDGDCEPTASEAAVAAGGVAVFVDEVAGDNYLYSVWIYQESNELDGIQRDDAYTQDLGITDENCGHGADTIVF